MSRKALLVVDMQKKFYSKKTASMMDAAIRTINLAIEQFRAHGQEVIFIKHRSRRMGLLDGQSSFELLDTIKQEPSDQLIVKTKGNAFEATPLADHLAGRKISELYVCGFAAEACVNHTYNGGKQKGFAVYKVKDSIGSKSKILLSLFNRIGRYKRLEEITFK